MLLLPLLVLIIFISTSITKAKINADTNTDINVFLFAKKPTDTYQTLNCQYRNRTNREYQKLGKIDRNSKSQPGVGKSNLVFKELTQNASK